MIVEPSTKKRRRQKAYRRPSETHGFSVLRICPCLFGGSTPSKRMVAHYARNHPHLLLQSHTRYGPPPRKPTPGKEPGKQKNDSRLSSSVGITKSVRCLIYILRSRPRTSNPGLCPCPSLVLQGLAPISTSPAKPSIPGLYVVHSSRVD